MNRQKLLLSVLLVLLALSIVYSYWKMPQQKTVGKLTFTQGSRANKGKLTTSELPPDTRVRLDLLDMNKESFNGFKRNIFGSVLQENPAISKKPSKQAQPAVALLPPPPPQPPPVQRDMAHLTFLGFLKKDSSKTVFLAGNNEIYLAKKGDIIMGRYHVTNITDETLTIQSSMDGAETVIPLVENRPLNVSGQ